MDTLNEKISYLNTLIQDLEAESTNIDHHENHTEQSERIKNVKAKLDDITARIGNSLKIYQVLPNIKIAHVESYTSEIDDLISLVTNLHVSTKVESSGVALQHWYDRLLYNVVKKQIASLSKCPMPMPKNLSFEAFNAFMFNESHKYTTFLNKDDISTSSLVDMISDLDTKKIGFMKDPFRSKLVNLLQMLSSEESHNLLPHDIIPIFKRCVHNLDFSEDEVDEILHQYDNMMQQLTQVSTQTSQNAKIDDKDVDILITAMKHCPKKEMFVELCDILNIPLHVRDILFNNILKTHQSQPSNVEVPSHYRHLFIE